MRKDIVTKDEIKVKSYEVLGELPDPFEFDGGGRVKTEEDWQRRKAELYKSVIDLQYGTAPKNEFLEVERIHEALDHSVYRLHVGRKSRPMTFRMTLLLPNGVKNPPVIVDGDCCFNYYMNKEWLNAAMSRGVAWALFDRTELVHDVYSSCGCQPEKLENVYNYDTGRGKGQFYDSYPECRCGAIAAWAWGYSRVVDALETIGLTDKNFVVFTGHSRGGKTCALAGALDERAVIVNPNETNAGACSCYRTRMTAEVGGKIFRSEELKDVAGGFVWWFGDRLLDYADKPQELPFDSHELKAMIAPRTLFVSEAADDIWGNPIGSWQTTAAAKEAYAFLGAEDELFWYFRHGGHFHEIEDVEMLVSLIERRRNGKDSIDYSKFFNAPFDESKYPPPYSWKAPNKA